MQYGRPPPSQNDCYFLMQKHDRNRDARLDMNEFKEMLSALMNATGQSYGHTGMGGNMGYNQPGMPGGMQGMGGNMGYPGQQPPGGMGGNMGYPGQQPPGGNYGGGYGGGYSGGPMPM